MDFVGFELDAECFAQACRAVKGGAELGDEPQEEQRRRLQG